MKSLILCRKKTQQEKRIKLANQNEDLKSVILTVSETLEKLETKILSLAPRFPSPSSGRFAELPKPNSQQR
jgi:hypothetical protein